MSEESTSSGNNTYLVPLAIIFAGGLIAASVFLSSSRSSSSPSPLAAIEVEEGKVAGQEVGKIVEVKSGGDPVLGDPNAPVTIIEFSDYQCPYCAVFEKETFPQIKSEYIDTGKVKLVFRNYLIRGHKNAPLAAQAAECAFREGKFWEMHDKVFAGQASWENQDDPTAALKTFAGEEGLGDAFTACFESGAEKDAVQSDHSDGVSFGVTGTPAFFIGRGEPIRYNQAPTQNDPFYYLDGKRVGVVGAQSFETFKEVIEDELK